jgi:Rrf2 family protein
MIGSSRKLFYATEAVMYIAYNASATPVSSKEIAQKQGLPPRYLEQMMQKLVRAGLLRGIRGPKGGYLLAKERRRITLGDIYEILRDSDPEDNPTPFTSLGIKIMRPVWDQLEEKMLQELRLITIADLCEKAENQGVKKASEEKLDFAI